MATTRDKTPTGDQPPPAATPWRGLPILIIGYVSAVAISLTSLALAYALWFDQHLTQTLDDQLDIGRSIAAMTADWLDETVTATTAASRTPAAIRLDPVGLRTVLLDLSATHPDIRAASVTGPTGALVVASGDMRLDAMPPATTGQELLVQASPATRKNSDVPAIVVAVPIRDGQGTVLGTLTAQVDLAGYQALIRTLPIGRGPQASVFDRDGYVLATKNFRAATDAERTRTRSQSFLPDVLAGREVRNVDFTGAVSGQRRVGVGVPVARYGWAVLVSEPRWSTDAALLRSLWLSLSLVGFGIVAGGAGLLWYHRQVARPLRRLRQQVAAPDTMPAHDAVTGAADVTATAKAVDRALRAGATREAALDVARARASVARLLSGAMAEHASTGLALVLWPSGQVQLANAAFRRDAGIAAGDLLLARLPGGPDGDVARCLQAAAQSAQSQSVVVHDGERWTRWRANTAEAGALVVELDVVAAPG